MKQPLQKITLRISSDADCEFVNMLTRSVMKRYVEATWESTKDRECYYVKNKFQQLTTKIIQCNGVDIGRITCTKLADRMILDGIHILEDFQGKGIGKRLISSIIEDARNKGIPVELILLKTNPVKKLYDHLGFHQYNEDINRYYMSTVV